jgi:nitroreductase
MNLIPAFARECLSRDAKQTIRAIVYSPTRVSELISNYLYDMHRFLKHSSILQFFSTKQQLLSWIDADFHKLEKGLALQSPRPGFGKGVAERLVRQIDTFKSKFGETPSITISIEVLNVYMAFNRQQDIEYPSLFNDIERLFRTLERDQQLGGCDNITREQWLRDASLDLKPFFESRRSVRDFSDEKVSNDLIEQAIRMAMHTPTVCNRQAIKTYAFMEKDSREMVLSCQSGNSGFGHQAQAALIVTVDRACFFTAGERNQCWIDGGLFSMSIVYALHSLGLGSCCLNWSVTKKQDQHLRSKVDIKDSEAVIMMIAVGHLKTDFKVAKSSRKSIDNFLSFENIKRN